MGDARIEAFLADVLALEGENPDAIREGVHVALADCEQIFKPQEVNRRMTAHACHRVGESARPNTASSMRRGARMRARFTAMAQSMPRSGLRDGLRQRAKTSPA